MPSITTLIENTLNRESDYRLLSAAAHGHHWAIQQIGFQVIEVQNTEGKSIKALEKTGLPNFVIYIGMVAVMSFSKVIWSIWKLYGWNLEELKSLLDYVYDELGYNSKVRFWQMQS